MTTIKITNSQWKKLNALKSEPGDNFIKVVEILIKCYEEKMEKLKK